MDKATPTDTPKMPSNISLSYDDAPELRNMKVGDKVEMKISGTLKSISEDSTMLDVESVEMEGEPTIEEAKTMPLDKLRKRLPKKSEE